MTSKVRVAVAGLGFVGGQAHVPAFIKIPGSDLVAIIRRNEKKAKEFAGKYGIKYYIDYRDAVKDPEIDALVVATPTPSHYEIASAAIANGKHVLCEMPLTGSLEQTKQLGVQAEQAGVILMPVLNFRWAPNYVKAKELIEKGEIGKPIAATFSEWIPAKDLAKQWPPGSWAWDPKKSGGLPDFTLSVWSIDLLRWLLNAEVSEVEWKINFSPIQGMGDFRAYNTMGVLKFDNGATCILHYSASVPRKEGNSRLEIFGDNTRTLKAEWNERLIITGKDLNHEWFFKPKGTKVWGHYQLDEHFIDCVLGKAKPAVTIDDAIQAQLVASKIPIP
ncbi:MAG: Gfo/Idh/MocA family protein [Candidatus Ranarchaeia archaeon]